jgi:hypothetical protein
MTTGFSNASDSNPSHKAPDTVEPSWSKRLATLFALTGLAVVVGVLAVLSQGEVPSVQQVVASWDWVLEVVLVIVGVGIAIGTVRLVSRGIHGEPPSHEEERHAHRRAHSEYRAERDPAFDMARARYARGEISLTQLEEILRGLGPGA